MTDYLSPTETAKLIRKALKKNFPGTKFSVRTSKYAGGSSVRVGWTDGPARDDVESVAGQFAGSGFDGMTDSKYSKGPVPTPDGPRKTVLDFVFCERSFSDETRAAARRVVAERWGIDLENTPESHLSAKWVDALVPQSAPHEYFETLVHRELSRAGSL